MITIKKNAYEKERLKTMGVEELKNVSGGVEPESNGESCTEHWLPDILKGKTLSDVLKNK